MQIPRWILALLALCILGAVESQTAQSLRVPPAGYLYHGVFPGSVGTNEYDINPSDLESYEQAVGRKAAWVYFSNDWYHSRVFPQKTAEWVRARGSIPYIRLMLRSSSETDVLEPTYTLGAIRRGDFDTDLKAWAKAAAAFGTPILVEWGTEMNGQWFSWNGKWSGGAVRGPQAFRETMRYIVKLMKNQGASNLVWVWHIAATDDPKTQWNRFENYYPGSDVVDWIGVSAYGGQSPMDSEWPSFTHQLDQAIPRLNKLAAGKPVIVAEFGASAANPLGSPERWAEDALRQLRANRWPSVRGFSWWNESWQNDDNPAHDSEMRVQKLPELAAVFKKYLASPKVLDKAVVPSEQPK